MIKTPLGDALQTVGELIAELSKLPPDYSLNILDADLGGYDVSEHPFCFVHVTHGPNGIVSFGHGEHEAWEKHQEFYLSSKLWN